MPPGAAAGGCTVSSAGRCSQQRIWSSIQGRRARISHQRLQSLVSADTLRTVSSIFSEANYSTPLLTSNFCLLLMSHLSHNVAALPNTWSRSIALFWAVASSPIFVPAASELSILLVNVWSVTVPANALIWSNHIRWLIFKKRWRWLHLSLPAANLECTGPACCNMFDIA